MCTSVHRPVCEISALSAAFLSSVRFQFSRRHFEGLWDFSSHGGILKVCEISVLAEAFLGFVRFQFSRRHFKDCLLGCCAVVEIYRHSGGSCFSHHVPNGGSKKLTAVSNLYQITLRNILEDCHHRPAVCHFLPCTNTLLSILFLNTCKQCTYPSMRDRGSVLYQTARKI